VRNLVMIWLLATLMIATPASARNPKVGEPAPPLELILVDGTKVTLAELKGQVVILNFWATWCGPCKEELPLLDRYYKIQQKHGLRAFAITTEGSLPLSGLKKLFAAMTMPSVRRLKGNYSDMRGVPTNYVIDRAGIVRYARTGAFSLDTLNAEIVPLLREAPPTP
jgi:cytochrome c biogenesis protein CcmG, thiol:disulfide interchange protein DsbE